MERILVNENWYEPVSSRSILEAEYEQSIFRYSKNLFPGYWCIKFNELISSDFGSVKADMVLIDQQYRGWTVIEAELEHHSFSRHVEPQMEKLVNGKYEQKHADAIFREKPELEQNRLNNLIRNAYPEFLVIVPKSEPIWRPTLSNMGVKMAFIEIYSNITGQRIVSMSGDKPKAWPDRHLTKLLKDQKFLPRAFQVETPGALPNGDSLTMLYNGELTTWRVVAAQKSTFLLPNGTLDLEENRNYSILQSKTGYLEIVEN
jgi:hypothetical protein